MINGIVNFVHFQLIHEYSIIKSIINNLICVLLTMVFFFVVYNDIMLLTFISYLIC